mmetsp:Transcript_6239/g.12639  ORF Transcript_6239/g.12639 Transcript_6239/m.12639 type:complete len:216 (+) Transcript_6239:82-729(+)
MSFFSSKNSVVYSSVTSGSSRFHRITHVISSPCGVDCPDRNESLSSVSSFTGQGRSQSRSIAPNPLHAAISSSSVTMLSASHAASSLLERLPSGIGCCSSILTRTNAPNGAGASIMTGMLDGGVASESTFIHSSSSLGFSTSPFAASPASSAGPCRPLEMMDPFLRFAGQFAARKCFSDIPACACMSGMPYAGCSAGMYEGGTIASWRWAPPNWW